MFGLKSLNPDIPAVVLDLFLVSDITLIMNKGQDFVKKMFLFTFFLCIVIIFLSFGCGDKAFKVENSQIELNGQKRQ